MSAVQRETPLKERVELALALGRIGDPRVIDDLSDPAAWVTVPAGTYFYGDKKQPYAINQSFALSKYAVTNSQFSRFVEAGGYANESLWDADGWKWRVKDNVVEPRYWRDAKWNGQTQPVVGVSWCLSSYWSLPDNNRHTPTPSACR